MASSGPSVSPAYQQIVDWYKTFQQDQQAKPIQLLASEGTAPNEEIDQPKETDPSTTTIDIIA